MPKKLSEMTDAEKRAYVEKILEKRESRQADNKAKRAAYKALAELHPDEFDKLLKGQKVTKKA